MEKEQFNKATDLHSQISRTRNSIVLLEHVVTGKIEIRCDQYAEGIDRATPPTVIIAHTEDFDFIVSKMVERLRLKRDQLQKEFDAL